MASRPSRILAAPNAKETASTVVMTRLPWCHHRSSLRRRVGQRHAARARLLAGELLDADAVAAWLGDGGHPSHLRATLPKAMPDERGTANTAPRPHASSCLAVSL